MIRRPPRSTRKESSAASDVYKRQDYQWDFKLDDTKELLKDLFERVDEMCERIEQIEQFLEEFGEYIYKCGIKSADEHEKMNQKGDTNVEEC